MEASLNIQDRIESLEATLSAHDLKVDSAEAGYVLDAIDDAIEQIDGFRGEQLNQIEPVIEALIDETRVYLGLIRSHQVRIRGQPAFSDASDKPASSSPPDGEKSAILMRLKVLKRELS